MVCPFSSANDPVAGLGVLTTLQRGTVPAAELGTDMLETGGDGNP